MTACTKSLVHGAAKLSASHIKQIAQACIRFQFTSRTFSTTLEAEPMLRILWGGFIDYTMNIINARGHCNPTCRHGIATTYVHQNDRFWCPKFHNFAAGITCISLLRFNNYDLIMQMYVHFDVLSVATLATHNAWQFPSGGKWQFGCIHPPSILPRARAKCGATHVNTKIG